MSQPYSCAFTSVLFGGYAIATGYVFLAVLSGVGLLLTGCARVMNRGWT